MARLLWARESGSPRTAGSALDEARCIYRPTTCGDPMTPDSDAQVGTGSDDETASGYDDKSIPHAAAPAAPGQDSPVVS